MEPGTIEESVVRLHPFANSFVPGHRLTVELSRDEPPDAFPLPVGRPVTHKIHRDAAHRSRLVLPFTMRKATEQQD